MNEKVDNRYKKKERKITSDMQHLRCLHIMYICCIIDHDKATVLIFDNLSSRE